MWFQWLHEVLEIKAISASLCKNQPASPFASCVWDLVIVMECSIVPSSPLERFWRYHLWKLLWVIISCRCHRHRHPFYSQALLNWRLLVCYLQPRAQDAMKWKWNNAIKCDQIPTSTMRDPRDQMKALRQAVFNTSFFKKATCKEFGKKEFSFNILWITSFWSQPKCCSMASLFV